ncbi:M48 family metallopeptidase [Haloarcula nitratireducens]|uniref:M48 family metalloprotease n=1 Tax=Haloarcula nitratireducens TaxID=2487749 RepID=A0AAW4P6K5_9EURY|nr:M48 family metallopeptidase [Halomicroarcula nitratireducens]MBX0293263.1 M48 family metalloprotease [Halomicroarcula nitratireducens]
MDWSPARGLRLRMVAALCLLLVAVVAATLATGAILTLLLGGAIAIAAPNAELLTLELVLLIGAAATLAVLAAVVRGELDTPKHAVRAVGARRIDDHSHPDLLTEVRAAARQADVPVPAVYVAPTETPLSLTTGFRPANANLVISEGLLDLLSDAEREAVLAHELAHVANRDAAVLTAVSLPVGAAERVLDLLSGPTAGVEHGEPSEADYADGLLTVGLGLVAPAWLAAQLLAASLSRTREFSADAGAVAITGDPAALSSALERIDGAIAERPSRDFRTSSVAAFAIVEPSAADADDGVLAPLRRLIGRAFATHPPTTARLDRLRELAGETDESTATDT